MMKKKTAALLGAAMLLAAISGCGNGAGSSAAGSGGSSAAESGAGSVAGETAGGRDRRQEDLYRRGHHRIFRGGEPGRGV